MDLENLIIILVVGALSGWLAGVIFKGRGFGIIGNIVVGIVGAVLGAYIFNLIGVFISGFIGSIITATIGAIILLYLISLVKRV
jgi:uncharacterized membrane protein YeaQ/YmgE (transglycosylase-associated protein family)